MLQLLAREYVLPCEWKWKYSKALKHVCVYVVLDDDDDHADDCTFRVQHGATVNRDNLHC